MDVAQSLGSLKASVGKHRPGSAQFSQAVSIAELNEIRRVVPDAPEQFFEFLATCDYTSSAFFNDVEPLSIGKIPDQRKYEARFYQNEVGGEFPGWNSDKYGCCKLDKSWRDGWIPIGNLHGDLIFLDMDPSENGIRGQVVLLSTDWWQPEVLGYSIAHWLERIKQQGDANPDYLDPRPYEDFVKLPPPK